MQGLLADAETLEDGVEDRFGAVATGDFVHGSEGHPEIEGGEFE